MAWLGRLAMFRTSLRRTHEVIDTQAITLIVRGPILSAPSRRNQKASNSRAATRCMRAKWERRPKKLRQRGRPP